MAFKSFSMLILVIVAAACCMAYPGEDYDRLIFKRQVNYNYNGGGAGYAGYPTGGSFTNNNNNVGFPGRSITNNNNGYPGASYVNNNGYAAPAAYNPYAGAGYSNYNYNG